MFNKNLKLSFLCSCYLFKQSGWKVSFFDIYSYILCHFTSTRLDPWRFCYHCFFFVTVHVKNISAQCCRTCTFLLFLISHKTQSCVQYVAISVYQTLVLDLTEGIQVSARFDLIEFERRPYIHAKCMLMLIEHNYSLFLHAYLEAQSSSWYQKQHI